MHEDMCHALRRTLPVGAVHYTTVNPCERKMTSNSIVQSQAQEPKVKSASLLKRLIRASHLYFNEHLIEVGEGCFKVLLLCSEGAALQVNLQRMANTIFD